MKGRFKEDFLHYIWQTKHFDNRDLYTTCKKRLRIRRFGLLNRNAGPDFLDAQVEIEGNLWFGHIEIHVRSSDWNVHKHNLNPGFQNVVLHVVYEEDSPIYLGDGSKLPCLSLKGRISKKAVARYRTLKSTSAWVPCAPLIHTVPKTLFDVVKTSFLAERLERRSADLSCELSLIKNDFNELIYRRLAWAMGLVPNAEAFKALAAKLPFKLISRHKADLLQVEALLFGQAGLLPKRSEEPYVKALISEFAFLKTKYGLSPMPPVRWKFSRMQPAAFPTVRIAQLAAMVHGTTRLDELVFNIDESNPYSIFRFPVSSFWHTHYHFRSTSNRSSPKNMGKAKMDVILINSVVPLLFAYGNWKGEEPFKQKAIELLHQLAPEKNRIINKWKKLGISPDNAADTQSLLELKKTKCDQFGCLRCPVGHHLIRHT